MLWRVHPETVNLVPLGKQCWFDSNLVHQNICESGGMVYTGDLKSPAARIKGSSPFSRTKLGLLVLAVSTRACHACRRDSNSLQTAKL